MKDLVKKCRTFIDSTPNAYYCVENIKEVLNSHGFQRLYESADWKDLKPDGKYYVIRNGASIIAFDMKETDCYNLGFKIVATHTDSPAFSVKPNPMMYENKCLKLNIAGYGSMINYSWLDRPLSLAGRVTLSRNGYYENKLINIDKDLLVIPSQAIHINRDVNDNIKLNHQLDMLPTMALNSEIDINDIIANSLKLEGYSYDEIVDYDLNLYNREPAKVIGQNKDMILSPRLDDLAGVFSALYGFVNHSNSFGNVNVFCAFDREETGNLNVQGADSNFLIDTLTRMADAYSFKLLPVLRKSFLVSSDNSHAVHPNTRAKNDLTNRVLLNRGIAIKHHENYITTGFTSSVFKKICDGAEVPYQDFVSRSDMICGQTLGKVLQRQTGIDGVDIGIPQWAMHSAMETMGVQDLKSMYEAIKAFYDTTIYNDKEKVNLLYKGKNL